MPDALAGAAGWALALGILGACIGSFIAALVVRWPEDRSVVHGRSACDACGAPIRARDLVPLLSAWRLGNRCAACRAAI
ncbi:MAG TPA: prepilin peptidase, partial [Sphingomonas sp.]